MQETKKEKDKRSVYEWEQCRSGTKRLMAYVMAGCGINRKTGNGKSVQTSARI